MGRRDDQKPNEVVDAEQHGGETFDPTAEHSNVDAEQDNVETLSQDELLAKGLCPDCQGKGIRDLQDHHVCQTCEGSGKRS